MDPGQEYDETQLLVLGIVGAGGLIAWLIQTFL